MFATESDCECYIYGKKVIFFCCFCYIFKKHFPLFVDVDESIRQYARRVYFVRFRGDIVAMWAGCGDDATVGWLWTGGLMFFTPPPHIRELSACVYLLIYLQ